MKDTIPEGFEVPLHKSVAEPILWMGLPRPILFAISLTTIMLVVIFQISYMSIIAIIHGISAYIACLQLTNRDPEFYKVILKNSVYKKHYY